MLQIHAETRRHGLGERGVCALGPGRRLVQQHRVERRPHDLSAVHDGPRAIRVEQDAAVPVDRRHGLALVESCPEHLPIGRPSVRGHQVDVGEKHLPDDSNSEFCSLAGCSGSLPRPAEERPRPFLQRLRGGSVQHDLHQGQREEAHGLLSEMRAQEQSGSEGLDVSGGVSSGGRAARHLRQFPLRSSSPSQQQQRQQQHRGQIGKPYLANRLKLRLFSFCFVHGLVKFNTSYNTLSLPFPEL
jgi:hypothetical protein